MKQSTRNILLQVVTGLMIITLLIWQGKRHRLVELDSGYYQTMGTFARMLVVAPDKATAEQSVKAALAVFDRIETLMSDYDPDSQISEVNRRAFAEPVAVDADVFDVLVAAVEYSRLSDGAFDITVGPVVQLWRTAATPPSPPHSNISPTPAQVGWRHLILDPEHKTVRFALEGMARSRRHCQRLRHRQLPKPSVRPGPSGHGRYRRRSGLLWPFSRPKSPLAHRPPRPRRR